MSLHTLAHHLQSAGRGEDKVLVHMTPGEVNGLQQLAMAHGGSLTINPHTGLPEAGWLSSILPMVAGAGLMLVPGMQPLAAAALVGAGGALATGSLQKGLAAGLGAYGGAGLASGLGSLGAAEATANAAPAVSTAGVAAPTTEAIAGSVAPNAPFAANPAGMSVPATTVPNVVNPTSMQAMQAGAGRLTEPGGMSALYKELPKGTLPALASTAMTAATPAPPNFHQGKGMIRPYQYTLTKNDAGPERGNVWDGPVSSKERDYFTETWKALPPYSAKNADRMAGVGIGGVSSPYNTTTPMPSQYSSSGIAPQGILAAQAGASQGYRFDPYTGMPITTMAVGGPVEEMSAQNAVGANSMYPQSQIDTSMYSNPMVQRPMPTNVVTQGLDMPTDPYTGEQKFADGGLSTLGGYSDGGRLLRGPGDGVSDSIPAQIGNRQPARLADGEFVVPARIVSELGNGSTEAGARRLYAMMERVQKARRKTVGKDHVAKDTNAEKFLPA